ncbi:hypothetical protein OB2597_02032 [Pseudooceanicola batsensis HTCC2597]|uniref:Activator of Hsp90 ATPase homologue 1/2-like C-terminal domain-containing protein n=1 Tax=Pseudooceanicola batsensis (strain ATCC BAA-863 / DSM 15984 / KCTC 12145 / HTCC2597) TaxID=252305 RepID=A3TX00_PSEBH|nr:SRPBCC family protein [Pseudooceanicola batsensis]EAQ03360.1 hypothetical protein OB2597_02032 [Pseudooceanicola batsensis HTCC2597]
MTQNDLVIDRTIDAPVSLVWRCWTEKDLLSQWWCPAPWRAEVTALEHVPGGAFDTVMHGPDGEEFAGEGCILVSDPERRVIFTSAMKRGFRPQPSDLPFTARIEMSGRGERTHYVATVMHMTEEHRKQHEDMGFLDGWGAAIGQLEKLAARL